MGSYATCTAESAAKTLAPDQEATPQHNEWMRSLWGVEPSGVLAVALGLDDSVAAAPPDEGGEPQTANAYRAAVQAALIDVEPEDQPAALAALALHFAGLGEAALPEQAAVVGAISAEAGEALALAFATQLQNLQAHPYAEALDITDGHAAPGFFASLGLAGISAGRARGGAFTDGVQSTLIGQIDAATLARLGESLAAAGALTAVASGPFVAGLCHGTAAALAEALAGLVELPEQLAALDALLMALAGPQGEALSFALGADLGASLAAEVVKLAEADPISAAYRLGQLSGPILAGAVLGVVGAGAVALGVRAARVLWGMLDELPALGALAQKLKGALPELSPDMATVDGPDARPLWMEGDADAAAASSTLALIRALVGEQLNRQTVSALTPRLKSAGYAVKIDGEGYAVHRAPGLAERGLPELHLDAEGVIREGPSPDRERLSTPGALSTRMEKVGIPLPPGFQAHHLIPDEVARTHPLAQAARARGAPPWDVDGADNGIALPGSPEKVGATGLPVHRGSHRGYTKHAWEALTAQETTLKQQHGSLDKVPPEALTETMRTVERQLRQDIVDRADLRSPQGRLQ
ncbi:AHH domain-containing protein [Myxococcota bacterium]|nr:AHH domain-containing protein [Myxococcota bacterium]